MPWTVYAIFVVFGLFVLLMITNPKLSCFGRRISSPLYPLKRRKTQKDLKTEDYGFSLTGNGVKDKIPTSQREREPQGGEEPGKTKAQKVVKTTDYGFHLGGSSEDSEK